MTIKETAGPMRRLGRRLQEARAKIGLSQEAVGKRFGVGKGTVSAWETGRSDPGAIKLGELAALYQVTPDSLLLETPRSATANKMASEFDLLQESDRQMFLALWDAYSTAKHASKSDL